VRWWHGGEDAQTPASTVRAALDSVKNHEVTVFPSEGHAIGITHARTILTEVARHG
jgi:hypothetical protein